MKYFSTVQWLTYIKICVRYFILKLNIPIGLLTGVLSLGQKRGIMTLTLVISRESARPTVTRGFCVMDLKFFRVKTKIQVQVEEYIAWKKSRGVNVSETLSEFIKYIQKEDIEAIRPEDIQRYYYRLKEIENAKYFIMLAMKDIRVMLRWFKARKHNVMDPDMIGNKGLTFDLENAMIDDTMQIKKTGRPPKVALIKKVKSLRDINKLSFREIARVIKKDVSQVHVWYYYDLTT